MKPIGRSAQRKIEPTLSSMCNEFIFGEKRGYIAENLIGAIMVTAPGETTTTPRAVDQILEYKNLSVHEGRGRTPRRITWGRRLRAAVATNE